MKLKRVSIFAATAIFIGLLWNSQAYALSYLVRSLGTLGGTTSYASGINQKGQVVGGADLATGFQHAFLYTQESGMQDLGTLGGASSFATGINDLGQVVGYSLTASGEQHAFLYTSATGMLDLGTLGGTQSHAWAINNSGQVVGDALTNAGTRHAFLYVAGGQMQDIGSLGDSTSSAISVNDNGLIVGSRAVGSGTHAFAYSSPQGMQDLTPDVHLSYAAAVNRQGQVVGRAPDHSQAFVYTPGTGIQYLGPGGFNSMATYDARGINGMGQVVGTVTPTYSNACSPFIFTASDGLNNLQISGVQYWQCLQPNSLNDVGEICGTALDSSKSLAVAVVLTPNVSLTNVSVAKGWNLLGTMDNIDVAAYFGDAAKVTTVWKWIPNAGGWAFYAPGQSDGGAAYAAHRGYALLTVINGGEGFWVNASEAFLAQIPAATTNIVVRIPPSLPSGWSLHAIGASLSPAALNQSFNNLTLSGQPPAANFTTLWAWDSNRANWYFYAPRIDYEGTLASYIGAKGYLDFQETGMLLGPGIGFWVNAP